MNKIKALEVIHEFMQDNSHLLSFDEHTAFSIAIAELNDADHDGCCGCAFESVEEWDDTLVKSINLSVVPKKVPPTPPTSGSVAQKPMIAVDYVTLYMMACNMLEYLSAGTERAKKAQEWDRFFREGC